jgi:hypothetical protein
MIYIYGTLKGKDSINEDEYKKTGWKHCKGDQGLYKVPETSITKLYIVLIILAS